MNVEPVEPAVLALLGDHRNGTATTFFIESEVATACTWEQFGQALWRCQHTDDHSAQADAEDRHAHPARHGLATPDGHAPHCRRHQCKHHQGSHQANTGHQHEARQHHPNNAAYGVERDHRTDIAPHLLAVDTQAQRQRESSAQYRGRQKHYRQRRRGKARAHAGQLIPGQVQHQRFYLCLGTDQPATQPGNLYQRQ
ncbi:hypothetical protein D3C80_810610 [compost metagenome]